MNLKFFWKIFIAAVAVIIVVLGIRFLTAEDGWFCQNGQWVKHGNPTISQPTFGCSEPDNASSTPEEQIVVFAPLVNQTIKSPFTVAGIVRGNWFFEASFPIKLVDSQGKEIAVSHVQSIGNWMTNDFVPFSGQLEFKVNVVTAGELILKNDNPSGLPQYDKEVRIPVIISPEPAFTVKAFFNNNNLDPEISCNKVFPVERQIVKTSATARAALEQLLAGPIGFDETLGYTTSINPGVKIQSLTIVDGVAKADFDETLEKAVGGSCRVNMIGRQITETLKQFPTVKSVVISINGRTEDILQP